jgi:hypothetical protein
MTAQTVQNSCKLYVSNYSLSAIIELLVQSVCMISELQVCTRHKRCRRVPQGTLCQPGFSSLWS